MPIVGIVAGLIALLILLFMRAAFLVSPTGANEWFGTWSTLKAGSLHLRLFGPVWIVSILFLALMIGTVWK